MKHLIERTRITVPVTLTGLERSNAIIKQDWEEKQERLARQREENRKKYFPELVKKEQAAATRESLSSPDAIS